MNQKKLILPAFIAVKFFLQYALISPEYELHRDEYLHLDQGHHPAWGYLSVPPVTSFISRLILALGNSVFWVKFFPALFGALTLAVIWKIIGELKGDLYAKVLAATCVLLSVLLRVNMLHQPNSLDVLCWAVFYYTVIRYIGSRQPGWLFAGAIVFAAGFLNKYNVVFQLIGLLPALLLTTHRKVFLARPLYLAVLLALVIVSPNLWWQYRNGFPVIHHLRLLSETHLVNVDRAGFLKSQFYFFAGSSWLIVLGLGVLLLYRPFREYRLFAWSFFFTLGLFLLLKAKDYYAIGLYPVYIAFGSAAFSEFTKKGRLRYLRVPAVAIPVLFFIPMYLWVFPNKSPGYIMAHREDYQALGLLRWEDGKDHDLPQDFADMLGWKELASKVDSVYLQLPDRESTLVLCDNYGQAGAINYYTRQGIRALSFHADYIDWFEPDRSYKNLIRVKDRSERGLELGETAPYFETATIADSIANPYAREFGTVIFRFTGARVNVGERIEKEIGEVKGRWGRN